MPTRSHPALQAVQAAISAQLAPVAWSRERASALARPLLERVHQSALAHKAYLTVRREDGAWRMLGKGVRGRLLRCDGCVDVELLHIETGAQWQPPHTATASECLLVHGRLDLAVAGRPALPLAPLSYAVLARQGQDPSVRALSPSLLYCRSLRDPERLPAEEARWWRQADQLSGWNTTTRRIWGQPGKGVAMLPLYARAGVASMLVRMEPGAIGPDHGHALDEDCIVLRGELFLGDILLRPGDYQMAPAGGTHFGINSDSGALFFFHGAFDPQDGAEQP